MVLKPKDGLKIPMPGRKKFLDAAGEKVSMSTYWRRLISSGDVLEVKESAPKESKKKIEKPEKTEG